MNEKEQAAAGKLLDAIADKDNEHRGTFEQLCSAYRLLMQGVVLRREAELQNRPERPE